MKLAPLYHATNTERGNRILVNNVMEASEGDRHWLGDGAYFFDKDFYAYDWLIGMFRERNSRKYKDTAELHQQYFIIDAMADVDPSRIFDLDEPEHKIMFDVAMRNCIEKSEYSDRFRKCKIPDGVVINILFRNLAYSKIYDVVKATFLLKRWKYQNVNARLEAMPQKQICIKNLTCIDSMAKYNVDERLPEIIELIKEINMPIFKRNRGYIYNDRKKLYSN